MNKLILVLFFFILFGCSKHETVLICGDHICVNKTEAKQYFEKNLSLEVQIINKNEPKSIDLVELNLKSNSEGNKQINIFSKNKTTNKIKSLTKKEIKEKKAKIREIDKLKKRQNQMIVKKQSKKRPIKNKKNVNKSNIKVVDVCTILSNCSIEEISEYLIKLGKNKKFPDITTRE